MGAPVSCALPALVLCGGRGTRLGEGEKPLVTVCGEPMLDRVARALDRSAVSTVFAVPSPQTPRTKARAEELGLAVVDAPGAGYVADLQYALDVVEPPVVTVVADLPLLAPDHVDRAVAEARRGEGDGVASLSVCVPVSVKEALGVSVDTAFDHAGRAIAPTGLNVVGDVATENVSVVDDERLAVNVNYPRDREIAESVCT